MLNILLMAGVFAAASGIGYILISRVPRRLHTPLMSMTNAISAVTVLGAMVLFAVEGTSWERALAVVAAAAATFNLAGGFVITDRMLRLFRRTGSADSGS